jgi:hypothetical protein
MAAEATLEAVTLCSQGKISNRMKITSMFPEMNPSMDSYRIGTILEMTRAIAIRLVEQNLRVRVCVQGTMVGFVRNHHALHFSDCLTLTCGFFIYSGCWHFYRFTKTVERCQEIA